MAQAPGGVTRLIKNTPRQGQWVAFAAALLCVLRLAHSQPDLCGEFLSQPRKCVAGANPAIGFDMVPASGTNFTGFTKSTSLEGCPIVVISLWWCVNNTVDSTAGTTAGRCAADCSANCSDAAVTKAIRSNDHEVAKPLAHGTSPGEFLLLETPQTPFTITCTSTASSPALITAPSAACHLRPSALYIAVLVSVGLVLLSVMV